ncbi:hypothetical protein FKM82_024874 [Ascaphus truei]
MCLFSCTVVDCQPACAVCASAFSVLCGTSSCQLRLGVGQFAGGCPCMCCVCCPVCCCDCVQFAGSLSSVLCVCLCVAVLTVSGVVYCQCGCVSLSLCCGDCISVPQSVNWAVVSVIVMWCLSGLRVGPTLSVSVVPKSIVCGVSVHVCCGCPNYLVCQCGVCTLISVLWVPQSVSVLGVFHVAVWLSSVLCVCHGLWVASVLSQCAGVSLSVLWGARLSSCCWCLSVCCGCSVLSVLGVCQCAVVPLSLSCAGCLFKCADVSVVCCGASVCQFAGCRSVCCGWPQSVSVAVGASVCQWCWCSVIVCCGCLSLFVCWVSVIVQICRSVFLVSVMSVGASVLQCVGVCQWWLWVPQS